MSLNKFTDTAKGYSLELDIGADEIKANQMETTNIDLVTINSEPYPPVAPAAGSVFEIQQVGAYNPLPVTSTKASQYILLGGAALTNTDITTINAAPYNGFTIRVAVTQVNAVSGSVTIKHNDPSQNPAEQKYPIICNGGGDIVLAPVSPTVFSYCTLIYNDNYPGLGSPAWVCTNFIT